jgi:hypothetical protein
VRRRGGPAPHHLGPRQDDGLAHRRPPRRRPHRPAHTDGRGENETLVATDAEACFLPAYVARHGYVGIYLDRPVDWDEVDELLVNAYRFVAPATLRRQLPA